MEQSLARPLVAATAAAVLGAGVLTAAPVGVLPAPGLRFDAVAPASFVGDLLDDVSTLTDALVSAVTIPVNAAIDAPFLAGTLLVDAIKSPSLAPNLASYGIQRYLNPQIAFGFTWPGSFDYFVVQPILGLLPPALSTPIGNALDSVGKAVSNLLAPLPNPVPGYNEWVDSVNGPTILPHLFDAASHALRAPIAVLANVITWVGELPSLLYRTISDAIANPSNIPGLLSNLVFQTVGLNNWSLVDRVVFPFVDVLDRLPGPVGTVCNPGCTAGWAMNSYTAVSNGWDNLLDSVLPTPVIPPPAAAVRPSAGSAVLPKPAASASISPAAGIRAAGAHASRSLRPAAAVPSSSADQPDGATADSPQTSTPKVDLGRRAAARTRHS